MFRLLPVKDKLIILAELPSTLKRFETFRHLIV